MNAPSRVLFRALLCACLLSLAAPCVWAKAGFKKVYLWRDVPRMETQVRDTILYYPKDAAGRTGESEADGSRMAVVICPGGSYHHLGMSHEGFATARWFSSIGAVPFVLQYRVAYNEHHHPAMLEDIQMALHYVRANAEHFGVDKTRVGAIGFSAGGHLVTMAAEFDTDELSKLGIVVSERLRPDFVMPIYPVVSMQDDIAHSWSRKSLLGHRWGEGGFNPVGHNYSQVDKDEFSMELNVPSDMPPVFLLACQDDPVVMFQNSVRLDEALSAKGIPHVFKAYDTGGHGFGMKDGEFMERTRWNEELALWLRECGFL